MIVVSLSDTHSLHASLSVDIPKGDLFIHAGDFCNSGCVKDVIKFSSWLKLLPHPNKIVVAGNHDCVLDSSDKNIAKSILEESGACYLEDSSVVVDGIKVYGSPYTQIFGSWSFMLPADKLKDYWDKIPEDTDVLITHSAPFGFGDRNLEGENCGCPDLLAAVERIRPRAHVYGHIHEGYGKYHNKHNKFYNVSTCTRQYIPSNPPVVFTIQRRRRK